MMTKHGIERSDSGNQPGRAGSGQPGGGGGGPVPLLFDVNPSGGPATGGDTVVLTGFYFQDVGAGTTTVTFGGVLATDVQVVTDTGMACTSPAHAAGLVDVIITNGNGSTAVAPQTTFLYA